AELTASEYSIEELACPWRALAGSFSRLPKVHDPVGDIGVEGSKVVSELTLSDFDEPGLRRRINREHYAAAQKGWRQLPFPIGRENKEDVSRRLDRLTGFSH